MKKISFGRFLCIWFFVAFVLLILNGFTLKSSIIHSAILASLGIILLVYPTYPASLENKYDSKKCRLIVRIIAVVEIIFSFLIHTSF